MMNYRCGGGTATDASKNGWCNDLDKMNKRKKEREARIGKD